MAGIKLLRLNMALKCSEGSAPQETANEATKQTGGKSITPSQITSHETTVSTEPIRQMTHTVGKMVQTGVWKSLPASGQKDFHETIRRAREQLIAGGFVSLNVERKAHISVAMHAEGSSGFYYDDKYGAALVLGIAHLLKCRANVGFKMPDFENITLEDLLAFRDNVKRWTNMREKKLLPNFIKAWPSKDGNIKMKLLSVTQAARKALEQADRMGKLKKALDPELKVEIDFDGAVNDPQYFLSVITAIQKHINWSYLNEIDVSTLGSDTALLSLASNYKSWINSFSAKMGLAEGVEVAPKVDQIGSFRTDSPQNQDKTMATIHGLLRKGASVEFNSVKLVIKRSGPSGQVKKIDGHELIVSFGKRGKVVMQFFGKNNRMANELGRLKRKQRVALAVKYLMDKMDDTNQHEQGLRLIIWEGNREEAGFAYSKSRGKRIQIYGGKHGRKGPEGLTNTVKLALYLEFLIKNEKARIFYSKEETIDTVKRICEQAFGEKYAPLIMPKEMTPEMAYVLVHAIAEQSKQDKIAAI
jgi:hypothetical protein